MSRSSRGTFDRIFGSTTNDPDAAGSRQTAERLLPHIEHKTRDGSGHHIKENRQALPEVAAYLACKLRQTNYCDIRKALSSACLNQKQMQTLIRTVEAAVGDLEEWERADAQRSNRAGPTRGGRRISPKDLVKQCQPIKAQKWLGEELRTLEDAFWKHWDDETEAETTEEAQQPSDGEVSCAALLYLCGDVLKILNRGTGVGSISNKFELDISQVRRVQHVLTTLDFDENDLREEFEDANSGGRSTSKGKNRVPGEKTDDLVPRPAAASTSKNPGSSTPATPFPPDPSTPSRNKSQTAAQTPVTATRRSSRKAFTVADLHRPMDKSPSKRSTAEVSDSDAADMDVDDPPGSPSKKQKLNTSIAVPSSPTKTNVEPQTPSRPKTRSVTTANSIAVTPKTTRASSVKHAAAEKPSSRAQSSPTKVLFPRHEAARSTSQEDFMPEISKLALNTPTKSPTRASRSQTALSRQQQEVPGTPSKQRAPSTRTKSPTKRSGKTEKNVDVHPEPTVEVKRRKVLPPRQRRPVFVDHVQWTSPCRREEKLEEEGDRIIKEMLALYGEPQR